MCNVHDDDAPKFYNEIKRIARKQHRCCECKRLIQPGEKYQLAKGFWDEFQEYKTCQHCEVAQQWLAVECGGFNFHGVADEILEHAQEYFHFRLYRYAVGMRRGWQSFKDETKLLPVPGMARVTP